MIYPTHDDDGQPDLRHMSIWIIRCDLCPAEALIGDAEHWHQGFLNTDPSYCPACVTATAKRLINSAVPRRRTPLVLKLVALAAVGVLGVARR